MATIVKNRTTGYGLALSHADRNPKIGEGVPGELFLNYNEGTLFRNTIHQGWARVGSIMGKQGLPGVSGPAGIQGAAGPYPVSANINDEYHLIWTLSNGAIIDAGEIDIGGLVSVPDNGITNAKLRDSAGLSVIGNPSNTSGDPTDIVAGTDGHVLTRVGNALAFAAPTGGGTLADNVVTDAKLADMPAKTLKGAVTAGDPQNLTQAQGLVLLGLDPIVSAANYGADTSVNNTVPFTNWTTAFGVGVISNGIYHVSAGTGAPARSRVFLADNVQHYPVTAGTNQKRVPILSVSHTSFFNQPECLVFFEQDTSKRPDGTSLFVQRNVNSDDGFLNPKAIRGVTNVNVTTSAKEVGISGECYQLAGANCDNVCAIFGSSFRMGEADGFIFGADFVAEDRVTYAAPTDVKGAIGIEVDVLAVGADHPTSNNNAGNRVLADMVAYAYPHTAAGGSGAEIGMGLRVRTKNAALRYGIDITDFFRSSATENIDTAIRISTRGAHGLRSDVLHSTSDIELNGNSPIGLDLKGTYTTCAIKLLASQKIGWGTTGAVGVSYNGTDVEIDFVNGTNRRISFGPIAAPYMQFNGTQVLRERITGWTAATGTATKTTFVTGTVTLPQLAERVKALIDDLITHGLIGT